MKKVVGIGLNKTGTKTLGECMRILGYRNQSYDLELMKALADQRFEELFGIMEAFDSFEDWPWPLMYREIDFRYPNAQFILTLRSSPEVWFKSLCRHAELTGPTLARTIAYGYDMPLKNEAHHIDFYTHHEKTVKEYFLDRPGKLLVVCWENGDGWNELCEFLGQPTIPGVAFPHKNKSTRK